MARRAPRRPDRRISQPERRHGVQLGDNGVIGPAGEHRVVQHDNGVIGQDGARREWRTTASESAAGASPVRAG
jgi:hypothetical protein